ncbi:MAG: class I SAM-dependent methyltransferase [Halanaeroarchaeum sp.]
MPLTDPFDRYTERYEEWFERYEPVYRSELAALERAVDGDAFGLEIGVGSGRFAAPLGIDVGVDPSPAMLERARRRGVEVVRGVAERLPIGSAAVEVALLVTTICFVTDIGATLEEAGRVLSPDGRLVMGYIDRESDLGEIYQAMQDENPFYRDATFVSTDELLAELEARGFEDVDVLQTVFHPPGETESVEPVRPGYGEGSFVVLAADPPA